MLGHILTDPQGNHQQKETDDGGFQHPARPDESHVDSHKQGDRNGHRQCEHSPGTVGEGLNNDQGQDCQQDDHNSENGEEGDEAADGSDLFPGDFTEGFPVSAHGTEQDDEILYRSPSTTPTIIHRVPGR